jgi:hypothetical protein
VTLDFTGFVDGNHCYHLLRNPLSTGYDAVRRWWYVKKGFDEGELARLMAFDNSGQSRSF